MGLLGGGAVAIWHDISAEGRANFYAWHGNEHMPERVGIPGFLRGRRYVAIEADLEFFNLYETGSPEVLVSDDYRTRLNAPTEWTQRTVLSFRNVARALCRVEQTTGAGQGGLIATWRYDVAASRNGNHAAALADRLQVLTDNGSIAGVHLLAADDAASGEVNAEEKARGSRNDVPGRVILVEGWGDVDDFMNLCRATLPEDALHGSGAVDGTVRFGAYQMQATVSETDIDASD